MDGLREYIVVLRKGINYDAFWNQIETDSDDDGFVPSRRVDIINERPGSLRSCHYSLTDFEAKVLQGDPRVLSVEIPPAQRDDIFITRNTSQYGLFKKTTLDTGAFINWGLPRCISETNNFIGDAYPASYDYVLDGTGVDIVIMDSGLQVDHPEFTDANGVSRVQLIDWYAESGLPGIQDDNHYRDLDGHGTHVAGTAAGKTYGWAKNSRVYSIKLRGLEGFDPDTNTYEETGISVTDAFDVIKLWHRNKPIDPVTGYKRPTIVNMSWGFGYGIGSTSLANGVWRGQEWSYDNEDTLTVWHNYGIIPPTNYSGRSVPVRVASVDADLDELIDEGVHVCVASGNSFYKIDTPDGPDYDNYFVVTGYPDYKFYYHRGSSPYSDRAFIVGNIDSNLHTDGFEQKASSSCTGPGVDIYAPGTNIMSSTSTLNRWGPDGTAYPWDVNYEITNISGTSMASPQVCGASALILGLYPNMTTGELKTAMLSDAKTGQLHTGVSDSDYADIRSILGGDSKYLFVKYTGSELLSIKNNLHPINSKPTYTISSDKDIAFEDESVTFTLTTTNVPDGSRVYYRFRYAEQTHVNSLGVDTRKRYFTVYNNTATVTTSFRYDFIYRGYRTVILELENKKASYAVVVDDAVDYSAVINPLEVYEGGQLALTVSTKFVRNGTVLWWKWEGGAAIPPDFGETVDHAEMEPIFNGTTTKYFDIPDDINPYEGPESVAFGIYTSNPDVQLKDETGRWVWPQAVAYAQAVIREIPPPVYTFEVLSPISGMTAVEGSQIKIGVTGQYLKSPQTLFWSMMGSVNGGDISPYSASGVRFTMTPGENMEAYHELVFDVKVDNVPENFESVTLVFQDSSYRTIQGLSFTIQSSEYVAPPPSFTITYIDTVGSAQTVGLEGITANLNEGDTVTLNIQSDEPNKTLYFSTIGLYGWTSSDTTLIPSSVTTDETGFATLNITAAVDGVIESTEWVYIYMRPWAPADNSKYSTSYANEIKTVLLKISD